MTALAITVTGAAPARQTASPAIAFALRIDDGWRAADDAPSGASGSSSGRVHAMILRCQVRIEPRRRRYTPHEQERLYELFGAPSQWDRTLQAVTWAHSPLAVPSFDRTTVVDLLVPCTYDLEVAASKYLHALRDGDIPLVFLFSGTLFRLVGGALRAEPVSWSLESTYRMPSAIWQAAMNQFFPGGGWVRLDRSTIDQLQAFRGRHALVTWDETIALLLQAAAPQVS
jgi:hypothetical protein